MGKIFFVHGNFGTGKTSICEAPMVRLNKILWQYIDEPSLYNLGGRLGYDSLSKYRKHEIVGRLDRDLNYLIHGNYFHSKKTFDYLIDSGFDMCIFILNTNRENNMLRIARRNGRWNDETHHRSMVKIESVRRDFQNKAEIIEIDNNRDLATVKAEIWGKIKRDIANGR